MPTARDHVEALIFGRTGRRFTQDTPVLHDVWIGFAEPPRPGRRAPRTLDLLLTPFRDVRPGDLARELRERLPPESGARVAYNQYTVAVCLTLEQLVRVVLPLSDWWTRHARELAPGGAVEALADPEQWRVRELRDLFRDPYHDPRERPGAPIPSIEVLTLVRVVGALDYALYPAAVDAEDRRRRLNAARRWRAAIDNPREVARRGYRLLSDHTALPRLPLVFTVSRNRPAEAALSRSVAAVKGDAAALLFNVRCDKLTWAVLDSGIDARHPAFRLRQPNDPGERAYPVPFEQGADGRWVNRTRVQRTYDFTRVRHLLSPEALDASGDVFPAHVRERLMRNYEHMGHLREALLNGRLIDWGLLEPLLEVTHDAYVPPRHEHGTHVAGILAGDWRLTDDPAPGADALIGVARDLRLLDLRVLDEEGRGDEFAIIAALQYLRHLNAHRDYVAVHGANLSLSIRHDVANYACGRTPVCEECERLVAAGVVVVAAAGNRGHYRFLAAEGQDEGYRSISITDPGNADGVITVGSTHRHQPHTYGVSYFSSRGPTGDGRVKPDLVAPGEKIEAPVPGEGVRRMDGTSMAAPHVSGVAALLMARHREFAGQPARVKEVLCRTATNLGREPYFQGHGMVDALRALQAV